MQHLATYRVIPVVLVAALLLSACASLATDTPAAAPAAEVAAEEEAAAPADGRGFRTAEEAEPSREEFSGAEAPAISSRADHFEEEMMAVPDAAARDDSAAASLPATEVERRDWDGSGRTTSRRVEPVGPVDQYEPVTAGVVDDNENFSEYLAYRDRHRRLYVNDRDVRERYIILVQDANGLPVHDAQVQVSLEDGVVFEGRTDAGGRVLFHPLALSTLQRIHNADEFDLLAQKGWVAERATFGRTMNGMSVVTLTLEDAPQPNAAQLDLLFLIDATGSMDDEIAKLKTSMADIADQIDALPERPDVRYGLVHYRDRGDAYVVRTHDFTPNLRAFQRDLADLRAEGGGDYPESVNEALHHSLHELNWRRAERDGNTVRLILLVADAPPHLDYGEQFSYDTDMSEAVYRGIKIFPVGASGLDERGEYIFRQLAQFTGGKFVFLTYEEGDDPSSGPGTETSHDVENYSVNTLDRLVVRLVREELAKLTQPVGARALGLQAQHSPLSTPAPRPTFTPIPAPQPISCTLELARGHHDCRGISAIEYVDMNGDGGWKSRQNGQSVMQITLDPKQSEYGRVRFDITYADAPTGYSVHIGDSPSNGGHGGDLGDQSNDAEAVIVDGDLIVFGNDYVPVEQTLDGRRQWAIFADAVRASETIALEVSNEQLGVNSPDGIDVVDAPYLFALDGQHDLEGHTNYSIYAAFNRVIASDTRVGSGVSEVTITFYPR